MNIPVALTIAGSDSGGGAGIQADLKTFSALGVYGASVLTALTAQNTQGVASVYEVDPSFIADQITTVCTDIKVSAVKIGMLHRSEIIETVAASLDQHPIGHVVLDPVMIAKSGHALLLDDAIDSLKKNLIPRSSIITPNLPEAAKLLRRKVTTVQSNLEYSAERLLSMGCGAVLIKGGHADATDSTDLFFDGNQFKYLSSQRFNTGNTHGTGCTLSSAICALLTQKLGMNESVQLAKEYISGAIAHADQLQIGQGHGPVHHFYKMWGKN